MTDVLNILIALTSIGLGAIGWLAPRYTMELLDMAPTRTTMGLSEVRAASGGPTEPMIEVGVTTNWVSISIRSPIWPSATSRRCDGMP